eukprot:SAG31_NODE_989_length_10527_cov_14.905639_10_plen_67_part_00
MRPGFETLAVMADVISDPVTEEEVRALGLRHECDSCHNLFGSAIGLRIHKRRCTDGRIQLWLRQVS